MIDSQGKEIKVGDDIVFSFGLDRYDSRIKVGKVLVVEDRQVKVAYKSNGEDRTIWKKDRRELITLPVQVQND